MKRSVPMKRTRLNRMSRKKIDAWLGKPSLPNRPLTVAALREAIKAMKALRRTRLRRVSKKTQTQRWPRLKALRAEVLKRDKGCRAKIFGRCQGPLEVHHILKRSQGGADVMSNLILLCHHHHQMTDWPYKKGRLVVYTWPWTRLERRYAADKWAAR